MKKLSRHIGMAGDMHVESGLHIGVGGSSLEIGGLDNPIVRDPVTRLPYVPGSSIKGKLRSLLEIAKYKTGNFKEPEASQGPCGCGGCIVCCLFGCGDVKRSNEPTRLIVRDCKMQEVSIEKFKPLLAEGVFYSEVKTEVTMDRSSGKVGKVGPRSMDRIAAGTQLRFEAALRIFEGDTEGHFKEALAHALRLLEADGLGGSVSRGYGQVKFSNLTWDGQPWEFRESSTSPA
jgi:CRISPR-associated protein Csm3